MKYPLPRDTFPPLHLSPQDATMLESVANFFVHETMEQYSEYRFVHHSVVDPKRWKKMKHRDDVHVYRDRTHMPAATTTMRSTNTSRSSIDFVEASSVYENDDAAAAAAEHQKRVPDMPVLLTVGTIEGTLDDVMYGFASPTPEAMQIKTAYVGDGFVDWMLLASLVKPCPEDPFRELSVRWNIKGHPFLVGAVMRVRDNVYLESIGFTETKEGERIGYTIQHSVELPEVRELHELNIVRGKVSFCHLFRQKQENVVELYVRGFVSAMGGAPPSLVAITASEFCVSIWKNMHCALMKKLAWMVRTSTAGLVSYDATFASQCAVCSTKLHAAGLTNRLRVTNGGKTCRICRQRVCSRCRAEHPLYFASAYAHKVVQEKMTFCAKCVQCAREMDSKLVAVAEMEEAEREFPRLYSSRTWTNSSLSMRPSETSAFSFS